MSKKFKISENANPNYLCTIARVGETTPIEGADKIVKTVINGYDIVISKDMKPGTIVVYFPVECAISQDFLSANNLFERSEFFRNANAEEVKAMIEKVEKIGLKQSWSWDEDKGSENPYRELTKEEAEERDKILAEIKSMCGFFGKNGRVRILKLRGQYSQGFIAGVDSLVKFAPEAADSDWESLVGTQFNFVGDKEICWKYVPKTKEVRSGGGSEREWKKRMKHLKKFDKLIDGQFAFHYDTKMLAEHIAEVKPDDVVSITVKVHGTSVIISNILCNRKLSVWEKIKKFFGIKVQDKEYSLIYSSRSVIKNRYLNPDKHDFYGGDPWGCVARDFGPYLDEGMTVTVRLQDMWRALRA